MRTTITIEKSLLERLREKAAREGSTISSLIADAVRLALAGRGPEDSRKTFSLVKYGRGGSGPLLNLDRTGLLFEMDDTHRLVSPGCAGLIL